MTVGIGAICYRNETPRVLVTADRMVTVGQQGAIEYEDTESKICPIIETDDLTAVAVGAGASTYIDEILQKTRRAIRDPQNSTPNTIRGLMNFCLTMYQSTVRDTIENQFMQPLGYTLSDLKDDSVQVPAEIQKIVANQAADIRNKVNNRVRLIVAGVGTDGSGLYQISGMDYTNFTDMGYTVIGSGSDSARLTFIRRRYDQYCDYPEGVFTILDAKNQAEERQGVGQQMDLVSISQDELYRFDEPEREKLRQKLTKIEAEERKARQDVIDNWEPNGG